MLISILLLLAGFTLLIAGGELLVRGAVRIAGWMGLSPMLVGLTIVALGTSSPELAASLQASLTGSPGIALGNIVGSNIANLLLILGCAALIAPMQVARSVLWRDGGVGTVAVLALLAAGYTFGLSRMVGLILLVATAVYLVFAYRQESAGGEHSAAYDKAAAAGEADHALDPATVQRGSLAIAILIVLAGLAVIVGGARLLVDNAIVIASAWGVSDAVIGLTVVAIGTSLPELATSAIAAFRKESDIALGNVLGSNIFNILFIGGATGAIAPAAIPGTMLAFDLWFLLAAALVVMLLAYTGGRLSRREGAALLAIYAGYLAATVSLN